MSSLPALERLEQSYTVDLGDARIRAQAVRFEGDWLVVKPADRSSKELWIQRDRVRSIGVPD